MKTALHEHIKYLESMLENEHYAIAKQAITNCLICANSYLETEKQQIVDSYNDGFEHGFNDYADGEHYYNSTFKN